MWPKFELNPSKIERVSSIQLISSKKPGVGSAYHGMVGYHPSMYLKIRVIMCHGRLPSFHVPQNTCDHVKLIDPNTKIALSSRIINRFQWFWMFWKPEHLLFHLKTTVLHNVYFLVEQNAILYKNVEKIWDFSSLNIWDLVEIWWNQDRKPWNTKNLALPGRLKSIFELFYLLIVSVPSLVENKDSWPPASDFRPNTLWFYLVPTHWVRNTSFQQPIVGGPNYGLHFE